MSTKQAILLAVVIDAGLFCVIGLAMWITGTAWPMLGLFFVQKVQGEDKDSG